MLKRSLTTFLIDDDEDDQEIFKLALDKINFNVLHHSAHSGFEALTKFEEDKKFIPDFIFLDLNMPKMNGRQCFIELKKIPSLKEIPVFIYSTSSNSADVTELMNMGATSFITKPSDIKELVNILSELFS